MVSEDRDYIERILAGEPKAFESIVRKYGRMGGAIAYAILGDFHLAEDAVQDSFLKAFRSLRSLREPDKFRFWFAGLVRSRAIDILRQRRAHGMASLSEDVPFPAQGLAAARDHGGGRVPEAREHHASAFVEEGGPESEVLREEARQKIRDALCELPEEDRLVVALKHMEGLSYKEIAEIMETSVSAVESRLFRARQALKRKLPQGKSSSR